MSAPRTALRFSVTAFTPSSFASAAAFSACFTVAVTRFAENNPCLRYARSKIPPSLPVPKTASFLSVSFCAIDQTLFTTRPPASTTVSLSLRVQCRPHGFAILPRRFPHLAPFDLRSGDRGSARGRATLLIGLRASRDYGPCESLAGRRCGHARWRCASGGRRAPQHPRALPHAGLPHALRQTVRLEKR